jgi:hypothetical protein
MTTQIDQMVIVIGPPKHGKTTLVRGLVIEHLTKYPEGIALVQDTNGDQFADICKTYDSVDEYRAAVLSSATTKTKLPRGSSFRGRCSSAIRDLAVEIGKAYNAADSVRVPIMLAYDEASMMESSGSTFVDADDMEMIAQRRHRGIAPIFNCQHSSILTDAFYGCATDVVLFGQPSADRAAKLEVKLGLAKGALTRMVGAPKFVYAHWKQGEGLV